VDESGSVADRLLVSVAMTVAMAGERIVVTGATGYIGSALVAKLRDANEVHVLARDVAGATTQLGIRREVAHHSGTGSTAIAATFEQIDPTIVFHLATDYRQRDDSTAIESMIDANVRFGSLVLDAASERDGCQVVVAGSHFQFAGGPGHSSSFYAATKNALCEIARYLGEARELRWIQPVLFDVYGPHDPRPKLVNVLIDRVTSGQPISLPVHEPRHHFVYIDDVVAALVASAVELRSDDAAKGKSVFISSDEVVSPSEVLGAVAEVLGVEPVVSPEPFELPPRSIMLPVEGPRPVLWGPTVGLREGIERVVAARGAGLS
jgi:CDP-paratose synthetase